MDHTYFFSKTTHLFTALVSVSEEVRSRCHLKHRVHNSPGEAPSSESFSSDLTSQAQSPSLSLPSTISATGATSRLPHLNPPQVVIFTTSYQQLLQIDLIYKFVIAYMDVGRLVYHKLSQMNQSPYCLQFYFYQVVAHQLPTRNCRCFAGLSEFRLISAVVAKNDNIPRIHPDLTKIHNQQKMIDLKRCMAS